MHPGGEKVERLGFREIGGGELRGERGGDSDRGGGQGECDGQEKEQFCGAWFFVGSHGAEIVSLFVGDRSLWRVLWAAIKRQERSSSALRIAQGKKEDPTIRCWLLAKKIDEELGDAGGFLVLEPVRGVCEGVEFSGVAVAEAAVGHSGEQEGVLFAPENAGGDMDLGVREFGAVTEGGAIPVHSGGEGAGLRPGGAILREIIGGERVRATGIHQSADAEAEIVGRENEFGEPRKLEKEHVPTTADLAEIGTKVAVHNTGMRDVEDGEFSDALRVEESGGPGDGGAPVVAGKEKLFGVELIGDGEDVGDEMGHGVVGGAAGFAAEIVAALVGDNDAEAGVGERRDLLVPGIPEFGKAVEKDDDGGIGWARGYGVKFDGAIVESQVFERG